MSRPGATVHASDLILSPDLSPAAAEDFLKKAGFQDPVVADRRLQHLAERLSDRRSLARLLPRLLASLGKAADPDEALLQVERFFEAAVSGDALLSFLQENQAALGVLTALFGASPFLSQLLQRNPEYFYWLLMAGRLDTAAPPGYFLQQATSTTTFSSQARSLDALRRLHRREYLRIATQDLLQTVGFAEIVRQVSELAEAVLESTFRLIFPVHAGPSDAFAVIAMGKLGGRELNFSSDVDLIYVFSDRSDRVAMRRFARQYTRALGEVTGEGRLYRVDLRLRPMGRGGDIAYPLEAYQHYWETGAETFERLALIKAREVAGDPELGREFVARAHSFVYRKYLDQAALEEMAFLKRRSDRRLQRKGHQERDVKLGMGGIREVEFFVQALQILYGGSHPELRTPSTLKALDRLAHLGVVELQDYSALKHAYRFLRTVEHRLQLVHDRQVQAVPTDPASLRRLMRQMRQREDEDAGGFELQLGSHQARVRSLFESLLQAEETAGIHRLMLDPSIQLETALETLEQEGIRQPAPLWAALEQLKQATSFPHSPARMRNLLANLLPQLLQHAARSQSPERLVSRLDRFCQALGSRVPMYQGMVENPDLGRRLFRLLSTGDFLAETLIRHPELLDPLAEPGPEPGKATPLPLPVFGGGQDRTLARALFKRRQEFKIAVAELEGANTHHCRDLLTRLADACLGDACRQWVNEHHDFERARWTLFALGKLGGRELTYHSDLDLVLLYDDRNTEIAASRWDRLVRWLKRDLESYTLEGRCYQLDFRLRPEGRKSALATPLKQARAYFRGRAEGWERLAYSKLRPVFEQGDSIDFSSLLRPRMLTRQELESVVHLRRRKQLELGRETATSIDFKLGLGGILDVLLVVQVAQLEAGFTDVNTREALQRLHDAPAAEPLPSIEWWDFWFRLEAVVRLFGSGSNNRLSNTEDVFPLTADLLGFENAGQLWEFCLGRRQQVRDVFRRFFSGRLDGGGEADPPLPHC